MSSGQKLNLIGTILLVVSLFLGWYSDKDVFRSGDFYTALNGPLYFVGISILALCLVNAGTLLYAVLKGGVTAKWQESPLGMKQMIMGFFSMYLLMIINSVYFHPQFGLNIMSKKSEIGVMLALVATVMICVGGYVSYRKKFEKEEAILPVRQVVTAPAAVLAETQAPVSTAVPAGQFPEPVMAAAPVISAEPAFAQAASVQIAAEPMTEMPAAPVVPALAQAIRMSERSPVGKTEYERTKLYENLKKTMIRDTLTPEKRRKLLAKEAKNNAFSANFGKEKIISTSAATKPQKVGATLETMLHKTAAARPVTAGSEPAGEKKPQMYRMDL